MNCASELLATRFSGANERKISHQLLGDCQLTAMSGLSAKTYSCSGEGGRFFLAGGEALFVVLDTLLKYRSIPPTCIGSDAISLSEESAEESGERSEEDMAFKLGVEVDIGESRGFGAERN